MKASTKAVLCLPVAALILMLAGFNHKQAQKAPIEQQVVAPSGADPLPQIKRVDGGDPFPLCPDGHCEKSLRRL